MHFTPNKYIIPTLSREHKDNNGKNNHPICKTRSFLKSPSLSSHIHKVKKEINDISYSLITETKPSLKRDISPVPTSKPNSSLLFSPITSPQINLIDDTIDDKDKEIMRLKDEIKFLKLKLHNSNSLLPGLIEKTSLYEKLNDDLKYEITQLNDIITNLKEENVALRANEGMFNKQCKENEKLKTVIHSCKDEIKDKTNETCLLKNEIKMLYEQIECIQTFKGKINTYDEFLELFVVAFRNYNPQTQKEREAFRKLKLHLNGYRNYNN